MSTEAKPLVGRIALVTGVSRGIGQATAIALAQRGAHIIGTVRNPDGMEELQKKAHAAGATLSLVTLDMTDVGGVAMLAADIRQRLAL